jgi:hypothetical protein
MVFLNMDFKLSLSLLAVAALSALPANAANKAQDSGSNYQNPWGPANPQGQVNTGFASWVFEQWNPPTQAPAKTPFFIDTVNHTWGINVPADIDGQQGYDAAYRGFTGDGYLDPGQTLSTTAFFTVPGSYSPTETPTEGIDLLAQSSTVPSVNNNYGGFGHQVLGIYLGPSPSGPTFYLAVHNTVSDENPTVWTKIPIPNNVFNSTLNGPLQVDITFKPLAGGNWTLTLVYRTYNTYTYTFYVPVWQSGGVFGGGHWTTVPYTNSYSYWLPNYITLSSGQYGTIWNKLPTEGVDAIRYFCSQGGVTPGGPLEWTNISVQ